MANEDRQDNRPLVIGLAYKSLKTILQDAVLAIAKGALLGEIRLGAVTVVGPTGTGNGTVTEQALAAGGPAIVGDYIATCVEAITNGGVFKLVDPNGVTIAQDITIVAGAGGVIVFTGAGITFKITDGSTDFEVGDLFTITVAIGTLKLAETVATAVDGSEIPRYIAPREIDATEADVECDVLGPCVVNAELLDFQGVETIATRVRDESYYDHLRKVGIIAVGGSILDNYYNPDL